MAARASSGTASITARSRTVSSSSTSTTGAAFSSAAACSCSCSSGASSSSPASCAACAAAACADASASSPDASLSSSSTGVTATSRIARSFALAARMNLFRGSMCSPARKHSIASSACSPDAVSPLNQQRHPRETSSTTLHTTCKAQETHPPQTQPSSAVERVSARVFRIHGRADRCVERPVVVVAIADVRGCSAKEGLDFQRVVLDRFRVQQNRPLHIALPQLACSLPQTPDRVQQGPYQSTHAAATTKERTPGTSRHAASTISIEETIGHATDLRAELLTALLLLARHLPRVRDAEDREQARDVEPRRRVALDGHLVKPHRLFDAVLIQRAARAAAELRAALHIPALEPQAHHQHRPAPHARRHLSPH
eukprot:608510-Rhodomonas_salina.1